MVKRVHHLFHRLWNGSILFHNLFLRQGVADTVTQDRNKLPNGVRHNRGAEQRSVPIRWCIRAS
jgi:hypothetical protein